MEDTQSLYRHGSLCIGVWDLFFGGGGTHNVANFDLNPQSLSQNARPEKSLSEGKGGLPKYLSPLTTLFHIMEEGESILWYYKLCPKNVPSFVQCFPRILPEFLTFKSFSRGTVPIIVPSSPSSPPPPPRLTRRCHH